MKRREGGCFCEFAGLASLSFHTHEGSVGERLGFDIKRNSGVNLAEQTAAYPDSIEVRGSNSDTAGETLWSLIGVPWKTRGRFWDGENLDSGMWLLHQALQ